ncbi:MAG: hypothetical protein VX776_11150 [Planctomycetota bacterium]|nr:hypothetical protein [Planctomycetota bacterium]
MNRYIYFLPVIVLRTPISTQYELLTARPTSEGEMVTKRTEQPK